ncbi:MAG TPA: NAD-binding protein [Actinopolymorphaceae bacterium]
MSISDWRSRSRRHYIVCGGDSTAARVVEELRLLHESVTAIVPSLEHGDAKHAEEIKELGARVIVADSVNEEVLRTARIDRAAGLALVATDDIANVHAALTAEELNPELRLVVHIVDRRLAEHLETLIAGCTTLSAAAMAAPAFVAAALDESDVRWVGVGGRDVVIGPAELVADPPLCTLARAVDGATDLLPDGDSRPDDIVLGTSVRQAPRRKMPPIVDDLLTDLGLLFDRRMRLVAVAMGVFVLLGTLVVWGWTHGDVSWLDSLYIALGTVTGTGISDAFTEGAPDWARVVAVTVQLLGVVMVSLVTAAIVDAFVGASLARSLGGVRGRPRGHVVVSGLGTVGTRVATTLHERGFNVVAIERNPDRPGVSTARRLRIPVLLGDTSNEEVLYQARIHRARAVIAVTNDDVANLRTGLWTRERNSEARVVLRLFDHDLANRVSSRLGLGITRSVSVMAAPAFVSELTGRRADATVPIGRRVLLVTEVPVEAGSTATEHTLGDLGAPGAARILAHRTATTRWDWEPSPTTPLRAGDRVALVGTLSGLADALLATRAPRG